MRNKYHIYCVFRIILDTYGIIMKMKSYILCLSDYFRHLWNYNAKKNHIYLVFGLFETLMELSENKNHIYLGFRLF